jgi:thioredoxin-related protein
MEIKSVAMNSVKKVLFGIVIVLLAIPMMSASWGTDFQKAKSEAGNGHKLILLKFSGSDWCVPCIQMEKEIFATDTFSHFADEELIMVNADFPRKAGKLDKATIKQNEFLAEQYDKAGHFPYTVLLNSDGKVLQVWDGYNVKQPEVFIAQIKAHATMP